jgi:hypothetical protein
LILIIFFGFLGLGFGLPLILEAPESTLACGAQDFKEVLKEFGLEQGLQPLIDKGKTTKALNTIVKSFGIRIYSRFQCIDEKKNDESQEVYGAFSELLESLKARIVYK